MGASTETAANGAALKLPHAVNGGEKDVVDAETAVLLKRMTAMLMAPPPPGLVGIEAARARASEIFDAFAGPVEGEETTQFDIMVEGARGAVPARVYRRQTLERARPPIVVFFHGGGWSLGALGDYDVLLRTLAGLSGAIFVSVNYRRAPEHPFPAGLNDARAAAAFIYRQAEGLGGDPARFAVMGDSAGGNLAAVVAQQAARFGGPSIAAQFLLYPMLDISRPHAAYRSRLLFGGGEHFLTRDALDSSASDYLDYPAQAADPRVSPINEPNLKDLPATFFFVGDCDPLRDESAVYADRLERAGVPVTFHRTPGAIHGFLSFGVLETARRMRRTLAAEIQRSLTPKS